MPTPTERPFERLILDGFATAIVDNPDATVSLAYDDETDPAYIYPDDVLGIYVDRWPQTVEGSVTITDYPVSDDPSLSDSVVGVQVTIKDADVNVVRAIDSDIFKLFHGRQRGMLGDVTLVSCVRASGTSLGQDSNGRQGRTANYYLTVHRPSTHRL